MIVLLYLAAIVAANLIVTAFGPAVSVLTAFAFIGLNLSARDRLHREWQGSGLRWKMVALIAGGSLLSWLLNKDAAQIAVASSVAFAASEGVDAFIYHVLRDRGWLARANGSNGVSAAVDSFLFPALAFGGFLPMIVAGQYAAKVFGGAIWAWLLKPRVAVVAVLVLLAAPASAQVANVSAGRLVVDGFTDDVVEVFVASPPAHGFRATAVWSVPVDDLGADATWLWQVSYDPNRTIGFDLGAVDTPFADPTLTVGAHVVRAIGPVALTVLHSYQPEPKTWTTVVKVGASWFRR